MLEFYEMTKKEIHVFTADINKFISVDISYKTHPDWRVIDAVYASSCIPIVFTPFIKDGHHYIDGALFLNYPVEPCIDCFNNIDSIFGIKKNSILSSNTEIYDNMNLMDYMMILFTKILNHNTRHPCHIKLKNEITINAVSTSLTELLETISFRDKRIEWVKRGEDLAKKWITDQENKPDTDLL